MAIRKLYIVRHGQTDFNKRGVVQGSGVDAPLNDFGRKQAQRFYEAYRHLPLDRVYTSALQRTHQSVAQFIDDGLPHQSLAQFNEIHWGNKEGQSFSPENHDQYKQVVQAWADGDEHARITGGESAREMGDRLQAGMEQVLNQPGEHILICMHGRAMRALLSGVLGYPLSAMDGFAHGNLCLYELTHTGTMFRLDKYNEQAHLAGL